MRDLERRCCSLSEHCYAKNNHSMNVTAQSDLNEAFSAHDIDEINGQSSQCQS